jgi:CheY-like chemotaxis protein
VKAARILVVDDNLANVKLLRLALSAEGYEVQTALTGAEALRVIATDPPALVLMDIRLPDIDGLTVTRMVKSHPRTKGVPVLVVTAHAMRGDAERARAAGCDDYLTKPIDTRSLPAVVRRHLSGQGTGEGEGKP